MLVQKHALVGHQPIYRVPGLLLTAGLIYYLNRSNHYLADFLAGRRYEDYALTFGTQQVPASVGRLRQAFNQINRSFQQLSRQKEAQHLYLQNVLALVNTGILSFIYYSRSKAVRLSPSTLAQVRSRP